MRRAAWLPLALVLAFSVLTVWETVARSTIPLSLDGQVTLVSVRDEDGDQRVWFVRVDEEFVRMDEHLGSTLAEGDVLAKDAWSRTMVVNGGDVQLELSRDARGALVFAPLLIGIGCLLTLVARRAGT